MSVEIGPGGTPQASMTAGLRRIERAARSAARLVDRIPPAPHALGGLVLRVDSQRRRDLAIASSSRFRELDAIVNAEEALPMSVVNEYWQLERELAPQASLAAFGRRLRTVSAEGAVRLASRTLQRTWRGWSDEDLWSLQSTLCRTLGAQLIALAEQTNGWPGEGTFEEWQAALTHHGRVLSSFGRHGLTASGDRRADDDASAEAIRGSLLWVVENLRHLGW